MKVAKKYKVMKAMRRKKKRGVGRPRKTPKQKAATVARRKKTDKGTTRRPSPLLWLGLGCPIERESTGLEKLRDWNHFFNMDLSSFRRTQIALSDREGYLGSTGSSSIAIVLFN